MPAYRFILRRGPAAAVATDVPMAGELLLDTESRTVSVGDGATAGGNPLHKASVGLGSVDNTADSAKPVSTAVAAALALKAPLASPAFTGSPTVPAPTAANGIATKKYVDDAVAAGGGGGGGTVSPLSLAAIDWDAAAGVWDSSGALPADGGAVNRWDDATGNGIYIGAVAAPTYRANGFGSGIPAVEFDGVDDSMSTTGSTQILSRASGFELLAVVARLSTALDTLLLTASFGGRLDCVVNHSSANPSIFDYADYSTHRLMGAVPAFETTAPMVVGFRFDGGRMAISLNGVDQLTKLCSSNASLGVDSATMTLGRHGPWSYAQGNCRLGRLLVWDHALTPSARAAAVGELRTAFGI